MAFCKYCGSSMPDKAEFCPDCGQKVTTSLHSDNHQTTDDLPSRREFFSVMGSNSAKKRIKTNGIMTLIVIVLRCILIVLSYLSYKIPFNLFVTRIPYYIFNELTLAHLLLLLSCIFHRRVLTVAALIIGMYAYWPLWGIYNIVGCIIDLVICILVLLNINKLEKEYRAYLRLVKK